MKWETTGRTTRTTIRVEDGPAVEIASGYGTSAVVRLARVEFTEKYNDTVTCRLSGPRIRRDGTEGQTVQSRTLVVERMDGGNRSPHGEAPDFVKALWREVSHGT